MLGFKRPIHSWQHHNGFDIKKLWANKTEFFIEYLFNKQIEDIYILFIKNTPIAFYVGNIVNGHANPLFIGYRNNFEDCSPGAFLIAEIIRHKYENGNVSFLNWMGPEGKISYYKNRFSIYKDITFTACIYFNYG